MGNKKTPTQEHFYSCVDVLLAALFEGVTQKFSFYENPFVAPPKPGDIFCFLEKQGKTMFISFPSFFCF